MITQIKRLITQMPSKNRKRELSVPVECDKFKELTVQYYQGMIKGEKVVLTIREGLELTKELLEKSNQYLSERKKIIQEYGIDPNSDLVLDPTSDPEERLSEQI